MDVDDVVPYSCVGLITNESHVLSVAKQKFGKPGYLYLQVSIKIFHQKVTTDDNCGFYEIIPPNRRVKLYFDIDNIQLQPSFLRYVGSQIHNVFGMARTQ